MLISYNWLKDYFEKELPNPEKLAEMISLHSFEVDGIEKKNDDFILDVKVLPNRAHDCLGYLGIAKEVALLFNIPLKIPELKYQIDSSKKSADLISLEVENSKLVARAMKRVVLDVEVYDSPEWLKKKS